MAKRSKIPFRKGRKVCIFCGGTPVTDEHIWPKWSHPILPRSSGHGRFIATGRRSEQPYKFKKHYERQGSVTTFRIPRVCGPCNSTWMSGYEEAVRPFIQRMMNGDRVFLNEERRTLLAEYLTMKIMVLDWADEEPLTRPEVCRAFYENRTLPAHYSIHLLNCFIGDWRHAFRSYFVGLELEEDFVGPDMPKNTKSFAIGFGNLFVLALLTEGKINFDFETPAALRLWPDRGALMTWPPRTAIDSAQANFVADTLSRTADSPNVRRID